MKRLLLVLMFLVLFAVPAFAQTPTATPTAAYDFPASPTLGQKVTGPGAQTFQWDGTKWIALGGPGSTFAPLVNPPNGVNNYAPINAPSFTGLTIASQMQVANTLSAPTANFGNTTISSGSVLMMAGSAALYFNGIPPGGTCPAGQAVTAISNTIVPTCAAVAGAFLPLTGGTLSGPGNLTVAGTLNQQGPAIFTGGATISFGTTINNAFNANGPASFGNTVQLSGNATTALQAVPLQQLNAAIAASGPWLPVNNPTFTGTLSGPTQVNTGGRDSLTWDYGDGLQASLGLGYGNTTESSFLIGQGMSYNASFPNSWTRGGSASYGPTDVGSIQMAGAATVITGDTGLTVGQTFTPTMLFSISPVAYTNIPAMGNAAIPAGAAFNVPVFLPLANNTNFIEGSSFANAAGSILGWSPATPNSIYLFGGAYYNGARIATTTSAEEVSLTPATISFEIDQALTAGTAYNATIRGAWVPSGIIVNGQYKNNNINAYAPTVSGGTLEAGSSDSVGEVYNMTSNIAQLNFSHCFTGQNIACVAVDDGQQAFYNVGTKGNCSVQFGCTMFNGTICAAGHYFNYFCFGFGG